MIDINYIKANRHGRVFHILGKPGDWEFLRERQALDARTKQYIFARPNSKIPDKRVELALTYNELQKVYEVTADITTPQNFRIDLNRLEAFRYQ